MNFHNYLKLFIYYIHILSDFHSNIDDVVKQEPFEISSEIGENFII